MFVAPPWSPVAEGRAVDDGAGARVARRHGRARAPFFLKDEGAVKAWGEKFFLIFFFKFFLVV